MPLILAFLLLLLPPFAAASPPSVTVLTIDGAISPAAADYFSRGLEHARESGATLVVLQLDTPGGLDTAMRDIVKAIIASPVPVATYVAPGGARAASAGTYILYASHVAAMAPGTNLGAATPVRVGVGGPEREPLPAPPVPGKGAAGDAGGAKGAGTGTGDGAGMPDGAAKDKPAQPSEDALTAKQVHDAAAYIRSLAQLRGRNGEWGERAVREAVSLSAEEALRLHVVDFVARDLQDLLAQVQGRHVDAAGHGVTLDTAGARTERFDPDWRTRALSVIASPSLALILMMIGIYGLLFEFSNPGHVLPGVVGGICLLLGLYAMQMIPISYTGLALIALGLVFMVAEVFLPTAGVLGVGGVVSFSIGAMILVDTDVPGYGIPLPLVAALAGTSALFVFVVVRLGLKARRGRVVSGREQLLGSTGELLDDCAGDGWARIHGETWRVRGPRPLRRGEIVRVVGIDGLTLDVEPNVNEPDRSSR